MANVLKDKNGNIVNCAIPRYEKLKYNLITDGPVIKTGRKIDDKDEYVKRINVGNLPNASQKSVQIGLDLSKIEVTKLEIIPRNQNGDINSMPFVSSTNLGYQISYYFRKSQNGIPENSLIIDTGTLDRSMYSAKMNIHFICIDDNYDPKA